MSKLDNIKPNRSTTNAHSKSTIRSLLKEIFKLIITIGNLGISYIEDWSRVLLKSAIDSRDTKVIDDVDDPFELEECVERAEYFSVYDQVDEIDKDWNGDTNTTNIKKNPIYDGIYDDDDDSE
jgi:hypothetical protein